MSLTLNLSLGFYFILRNFREKQPTTSAVRCPLVNAMCAIFLQPYYRKGTASQCQNKNWRECKMCMFLSAIHHAATDTQGLRPQIRLGYKRRCKQLEKSMGMLEQYWFDWRWWLGVKRWSICRWTEGDSSQTSSATYVPSQDHCKRCICRITPAHARCKRRQIKTTLRFFIKIYCYFSAICKINLPVATPIFFLIFTDSRNKPKNNTNCTLKANLYFFFK